jgi:hypothetical protein
VRSLNTGFVNSGTRQQCVADLVLHGITITPKSISVPDRQTHRDVCSRTVPQNNFEGHGASWCAYFNLNKLERRNTNLYFTFLLFSLSLSLSLFSHFQLPLFIHDCMSATRSAQIPVGSPRNFTLYNGAYHLQHNYCSFCFTCIQK